MARQFSLRRLLVLVAIMGVVFAVGAILTKNARQRMAIRSQLSSLGAYSVAFNEKNEVVAVAFHEPDVTQDLSRFGSICTLDFKEASVSHESLRFVSELHEIDLVTFNLSNIDDRSLAALLNCRGVRALDLSDTLITDAAVDIIARIPKLEWVDLSNTKVTEQGVTRLRESQPELKVAPIFKR